MQKDTFKPYSLGEAKGNWLQPKVAPQGGPVCLPLVATHSEKTSGGEVQVWAYGWQGLKL